MAAAAADPSATTFSAFFFSTDRANAGTNNHLVCDFASIDDFGGTSTTDNQDRVSRDGYGTTPAGTEGIYRGTWSNASVTYALADRVFHQPPSWTVSTVYAINQVVFDTADSRIYRCTTGHTAATRPSAGDPNWTRLDTTTHPSSPACRSISEPVSAPGS